jgi:hypothetical protein
MLRLKGSWLVAMFALTSAVVSIAEEPGLAPGQVSGVQLQSWLDQRVAFAGVNHQNACHLMTVGEAKARIMFLSCPDGFADKLQGSARVQGNMHCTTFPLPGRPVQEQCREWFKVGDNKYEARANGVATSTQYLLLK